MVARLMVAVGLILCAASSVAAQSSGGQITHPEDRKSDLLLRVCE